MQTLFAGEFLTCKRGMGMRRFAVSAMKRGSFMGKVESCYVFVRTISRNGIKRCAAGVVLLWLCSIGTTAFADLSVVTTVPVHSPTGIAVTPDGNYALVCNRQGSVVEIINTLTNEVEATVPVGSVPLNVAITPNGNYAYVSNTGGDTVSVINISTRLVEATVPLVLSPRGIAVTLDGNYVYVACSSDDTVAVISTSTNEVDTIISVGSKPMNIAFTPDGNYAYVAHLYSLSVINLSTNTVEVAMPLSGSMHYIAITPDGNYAYVTNSSSVVGEASISVINLSTNTIEATVLVDIYPGSIAITPDGNYVLFSNSTNVSVMNVSDNTVETTLLMDYTASGIAITPDGNNAYVTLYQADTVSVITTDPIGINVPPVAAIAGGDLSAYAGDLITLDGSASYDPEGSILSYEWIITSDPDNPVISQNAIFEIMVHGFAEEMVQLKVTDDRGGSSTDSILITNPGIVGPPGPQGIQGETGNTGP
ncbi:MAG: YncE family protein, partial [Candidatus Aureabacteria bacterium]|nr:YncE family protein [Candidatus Auribacterota bacterium]